MPLFVEVHPRTEDDDSLDVGQLGLVGAWAFHRCNKGPAEGLHKEQVLAAEEVVQAAPPVQRVQPPHRLRLLAEVAIRFRPQMLDQVTELRFHAQKNSHAAVDVASAACAVAGPLLHSPDNERHQGTGASSSASFLHIPNAKH